MDQHRVAADTAAFDGFETRTWKVVLQRVPGALLIELYGVAINMGVKDHGFVDKARPREGVPNLRPALDQQARHALPGEPLGDGRNCDLSSRDRRMKNAGPSRFQRGHITARRLRPAEDPKRRIPGTGRERTSAEVTRRR